MSEEVNPEQLKKEVINEVNRLRTNPKAYIPILNKYLDWFDGNVLNKPGSEFAIETKEGPDAYQNAINFLKNQKPIKPIQYDDEISKASQSHADDLASSDNMGPIGSDGRDNYQRVTEYVEWDEFLAECIDFGGLTGEEVIISLIVDDGAPEKVHRETLFSLQCENFGVGCAVHPTYDTCTVIDLVGEIKSYPKNRKKNVVTIQKEAIKKMSHLAENKEKEKGKTEIGKLVTIQERQKMLKDLNTEYEDEFDRFSDDSDAPEGAVHCKIKVTQSRRGKNIITTTTKIYTLQDGSEETVTLEEKDNE